MTAWALTEQKRRGAILDALADGPANINAIAEATGMTASAVVRTLRPLSLEGAISVTGQPGVYASTEAGQ